MGKNIKFWFWKMYDKCNYFFFFNILNIILKTIFDFFFIICPTLPVLTILNKLVFFFFEFDVNAGVLPLLRVPETSLWRDWMSFSTPCLQRLAQPAMMREDPRVHRQPLQQPKRCFHQRCSQTRCTSHTSLSVASRVLLTPPLARPVSQELLF